MFLASIADDALRFFVLGGVFMVFLLLLSVVVGTVVIFRGCALREAAVMPPALVREMMRLEPGDDLVNLQRLLPAHRSPLARILETLIRHITWPRDEASEAVQMQARHELAYLEKGLVMLEISTGIAPVLGLLGTLSGLVSIFSNIGDTGDPVAIGRGIAEALNTTIVGLAIAAVSIVAFNYFQRKIEIMSVAMETLIADLIVKCYPQGAHGATPTIQYND